MPEEVLRLGIDPRPAVQGSRQYERAGDRVIRSSREMDRAVGGAEAGFRRLNPALVTAASAITGLMVTASIEATRRLVQLGSEVEETANKFDVVFGGSAESARAELELLNDTVPLTASEMERLASGVQDMLVPMGLARSAASDMSVEFVRLAGDLGSFNNVAPVEVLQALQSALAGSSEPMRRFGVDTRVARLEAIALEEGLIRAGQEMDETARAQAVLLAVQRDSADAMGDAERTADSTANTLKRLGRDVRQTSENLGVLALEGLESSGALGQAEDAMARVLSLIEENGDRIINDFAVAFGALADTIEFASNTALGFVIVMERLEALGGIGILAPGGNFLGDIGTGGEESALSGFEQDLVSAIEQQDRVTASIERGQEFARQLAEERARARQEAEREAEAAAAARAEAEKALEAQIDLLTRAVAARVDEVDAALRLLEIQNEQESILEDLTRSREERVEAAERELEIERSINRFLARRQTGGAVASQTVSVDLGVGAIQMPDLEPLNVALGDMHDVAGRAAQEARDLTEGIDGLQVADQVIGPLASVADNLFGLDGASRSAVRGLSDIIDSALQLRDAGGLGSLAGIGGAVGIAAGVAGLVGGLFDDSTRRQQEAERNRILEQNNDRLQDLAEALREQGRTAAEFRGTAEEARRVAAALSDRETRLPLLGGENVPDVERRIEDLGVSLEDLEAIARDAGIEIFDSAGRIIPSALDQLGRAADRMAEQIELNQARFLDELEVRRLLATGQDEAAAALRRQIENEEEVRRARERGFDDATVAELERIQRLEEAARAAEAAAEAERELARERADFDATLRGALTARARRTGDTDALRAIGEAEIEETLARFAEVAGITDDELILLSATLRGELNAELEAFEERARDAAAAAREAAEAELFRQMMDKENLKLQILRAQGLDAEADALERNLAIQAALHEGKDAEYIQLLRQLHAIQAQNKAERERERAIQRSTREIQNQTRWLNAPAGRFNPALLRGQTITGDIFGVRQPDFGGGGDTVTNFRVDQVTIQAAPGDSGADLWDKFIAEGQRRARASGFNELEILGEG